MVMIVPLADPVCWPSFPRTCREAALLYIRKGIPVFPIQGKVPLRGTKGYQDASTDPDQIRWWWKRWPEANVAAPTGGLSGWVVLDVDGQHNGFVSFQHLQELAQTDVPLTRMARTGSGIHLFFQVPAFDLRNSVEFAGLQGIDIRGQGGYVVLPPSRHSNGRHYRWLSLLPAAPFPPFLWELKEQHKRDRYRSSFRGMVSQTMPAPFHKDPEYWVKKALAHVAVGKRHTCALWLSCRLIQQAHLSPQQAEGYLRAYVDQVPGDGDYSLDDALRCLQWAATHLV